MTSPIVIGGRGYELLVDPDQDRATTPRISNHRLIAYAHGEIDEPFGDLNDEIEVDHLDGIPWLSYIDGLDAVDPVEHGRRTRERELRRKARV